MIKKKVPFLCVASDLVPCGSNETKIRINTSYSNSRELLQNMLFYLMKANNNENILTRLIYLNITLLPTLQQSECVAGRGRLEGPTYWRQEQEGGMHWFVINQCHSGQERKGNARRWEEWGIGCNAVLFTRGKGGLAKCTKEMQYIGENRGKMQRLHVKPASLSLICLIWS